MFAPTCSYQLEFPLKERRSFLQILKRVCQCLLCVLLIVYLFYQHIIPICRDTVVHIDNRDAYKIIIAVLKIGMPGAYIWLCVFYLVFHSLLNLCGEMTRFADRRFYSDWWNAGNLSEYWRKWNYPIHSWLMRHVYYPVVRRKINSDVAKVLTFMVSAIFHEYVVIGTFRIFNFMAFLIMIVNIPVIQFQQTFRKQIGKNINNQVYWISYVIIGQPLAILLCYYQCNKQA